VGRPGYTGRLLVDCADRPGIVAAVSGFLFDAGANIVSSHQYSSDPSGGRFFLRTEFFLEEESLAEGLLAEGSIGQARGPAVSSHEVLRAAGAREALRERFQAEVAERFQMDWLIRWWDERRRVAILVSRHDHCLVDLLWRQRRGELDAEVVAVVSNHPDLRGEAEAAGVPFHHVPVLEEGGMMGAEARMLELLAGEVDVVVLARYMQILSGDFLARIGAPVINIHHSFLPAFAGADPYRRAREHGVKLIGATAHYVIEELDAGPIVEQGVERVDHRQSAAELEWVGRDIERIVLARALALHLDDRVIIDGGRTVVF
jgi:formyltetrahydrofolate deformylase